MAPDHTQVLWVFYEFFLYPLIRNEGGRGEGLNILQRCPLAVMWRTDLKIFRKLVRRQDSKLK